jgi:DNA-binding beta-propeller fold protein YncE
MKKLFVWLAMVITAATAWQAASADDQRKDRNPRMPDAPEFKVDANWPKPLPNQWLFGQVAGVAVDRHDHIWIIQRPGSLTADEAGAVQNPPRSECCRPAPSVMKFDREGNLLQAWGGPADPGFLTNRCTPASGCEWPTNEHGIFVDHNDNVWIAGNGTGNHQVLKFSRDGTFLLQIGKAGLTGGSNATNGAPNGTPLLGQPADVEVDPVNNEAYIADGYQNKRVLVVDGMTGKYLRHWGAYGRTPDDVDAGPYVPTGSPALQFRNPVHCVKITNDGLVYVCDRVNNRIQVFHKDGTFVKEFFVAANTLGNGSTWDVDTSPDRGQRWLYNADGENNKVWILDRPSGVIADSFGRNGRYAGQFHWVHNLAVDSNGNIYTAEVDTGKRAQKFTPVDNRGSIRDNIRDNIRDSIRDRILDRIRDRN